MKITKESENKITIEVSDNATITNNKITAEDLSKALKEYSEKGVSSKNTLGGCIIEW